MSGARKPVLVLGIGNILWADEGFGVRCAEAFAAAYETPAHITVMDGGTQGLALVGDVAAAARVIVFDAVDFGAAPGTLIEVRGDAVPSFIAAGKMSLHQAGFEDILACARLIGGAPEELLLIGVQPVELEDYGGSLRPQIKALVPEAVRRAAAALQAWGEELTPRHAPGSLPDFIAALAIDVYEAGRPSAEAACRFGDARVLAGL